MSNNLGVGKTLELLDRLRSAARELGARGDKLNQEHQAWASRERRQREAAAVEQARQLAAAIAEAESV